MEENKNKILNVPTLRFKQFQDNWSSKRLSDIAEVVGGGTPDTTDSTLWNGGIQWFTPTEIGHSKYVSMSARTISQLGLQKSSAKILPAGSILLSSRATVGECSITQKDCTTNQGFQNLTPKKGINNEFLYYLAQTQKRHFIKYASGSTFLEISNSEIKKTKCAVPGIEEQTEIATFLSTIDKKIEVQNKIISKYESLIKGLCDKIFRHDKSVCLFNLVKCKTSILQENEIATYYNGEYNVFGASGIIANINKYQFEKDGILVLKDGSKAGKIQYAGGKYSVVGTSVVLIPNNADDARYLYFAMLSIDFDKYKVGSGIPHIYFKDYSCERIYYPNLALRIRIAKELDAYEKKVEIEKEMLSVLQKQKAFLLHSMFI